MNQNKRNSVTLTCGHRYNVSNARNEAMLIIFVCSFSQLLSVRGGYIDDTVFLTNATPLNEAQSDLGKEKDELLEDKIWTGQKALALTRNGIQSIVESDHPEQILHVRNDGNNFKNLEHSETFRHKLARTIKQRLKRNPSTSYSSSSSSSNLTDKTGKASRTPKRVKKALAPLTAITAPTTLQYMGQIFRRARSMAKVSSHPQLRMKWSKPIPEENSRSCQSERWERFLDSSDINTDDEEDRLKEIQRWLSTLCKKEINEAHVKAIPVENLPEMFQPKAPEPSPPPSRQSSLQRPPSHSPSYPHPPSPTWTQSPEHLRVVQPEPPLQRQWSPPPRPPPDEPTLSPPAPSDLPAHLPRTLSRNRIEKIKKWLLDICPGGDFTDRFISTIPRRLLPKRLQDKHATPQRSKRSKVPQPLPSQVNYTPQSYDSHDSRKLKSQDSSDSKASQDSVLKTLQSHDGKGSNTS